MGPLSQASTALVVERGDRASRSTSSTTPERVWPGQSAVLRCIFEIGVDVVLRIDDHGAAARLVTHQVRGVREAIQRVLLEEIVGDMRPLLGHRRFLPPLGTARINPLAWCGDPARVRGRGQTAAAGRPRTPDTMAWRGTGYRQTTARAGGPATSRREREGGRGLVVSRGRQSGRRLGVVPCAPQREVGEDALVVDGGDQFRPAGTAQTAQDVHVDGPAHERRPQ
jgi:hypothetical protein